MAYRKHAHVQWSLPETQTGALANWDHVTRALLMDIRDELKQLNTTLGCYRVARMSDDINRIDRRLAQQTKLPASRLKKESK